MATKKKLVDKSLATESAEVINPTAKTPKAEFEQLLSELEAEANSPNSATASNAKRLLTIARMI